MSVVVPFLGDLGEASEVVRSLEALDSRPGDEVIVADNTPERVAARLASAKVSVADASDTRSASHARNVAAESAAGEWLLFTDADCVLPVDIIDRYFAEPVDERCAIVAGEIVGSSAQGALLAEWACSRRGLWVQHHLDSGPHPAGITANLLVRRTAWEELGGFRIGGGGDLDLCWRAQEAGWTFSYRPDVVVVHEDRERLSELVSQAISYGSHGRHLRSLHGPSVERARLLRPLGRALAGIAAWALRADAKRAAFSAIDALWALFYWIGDMTAGRGVRRAD